ATDVYNLLKRHMLKERRAKPKIRARLCRTLVPEARSMQLDALFPLTPALSLRERENICQNFRQSPASGPSRSGERCSLSLGRGPGCTAIEIRDSEKKSEVLNVHCK